MIDGIDFLLLKKKRDFFLSLQSIGIGRDEDLQTVVVPGLHIFHLRENHRTAQSLQNVAQTSESSKSVYIYSIYGDRDL